MGCGITFVVAFAASMPVLFVWAWGGAHCEPVPGCRNLNNLNTLMLMAGILTYACVVGWLFRSTINFIAKKLESQGFSLPFMGSAIAAAAIVIAVSLWAGLRLADALVL